MNLWEGYMNWPLNKEWVCELCGQRTSLIWGMKHGRCRCNVCHTEYEMRTEAGEVVDIPIWQMKAEYRTAARQLWQDLHKPMDLVTDAEWDSALTTESEENDNGK